MAIPATPTNLNVQQGNGQVFLSWDIVAGITSYSVQRSTDGVVYSAIAAPTTNLSLDATVSLNTKYYYQVASTNASGTSPYTTPQWVIPTATGLLSLGQLRQMAQQRADMENSQFVTLTEWNTYINQSYFELYDLLITAYEDYAMAPPVTLTADGTSQQYTLPNGVLYSAAKPFYKLLGVDFGVGGSSGLVTMKKFNFMARNRYIYPQITSTYLNVFNPQYRLMGDTIFFIPTPAAGQSIKLWYIPRITQLLQDTDVADGVSGWTEYIIVDAAIKAMQKEESDVTVLGAQKMMLKERIEASAQNRDAGQPDTISNVRSWGERWGGGGGGYWDGNFGGS